MTPELASDAQATAVPAPASPFAAALKRLPLPKLYRVVPTPAAASAEPAQGARKPMIRALGFGGALVAVLGVMSYLGNPTELLGGKAASANLPSKPKIAAKEASRPLATVASAVKPTGRTAFGIPLAAEATKDSVAAPSTPRITAPKPAAPKPAARAAAANSSAEDALLEDAVADDARNVPAATAVADDPAPTQRVAHSVAHAPRIALSSKPAGPRAARSRALRPKTRADKAARTAKRTVAKSARHRRPAAPKAAPATDTIRIYDATSR